MGVGKEKRITYGEGWRLWADHFTNTEPLKCTEIER